MVIYESEQLNKLLISFDNVVNTLTLKGPTYTYI